MKYSSKEHLTNDQLWYCIDNNSIPSEHEEHLASCRECSMLLSEMQSIHQELKELTVIEPSPEFSMQVVTKWERSMIRFPWFTSMLISFFVILFLASMYLAIQSKWQYSATSIQAFYFIIIICGYRLFDMVTRKNFGEDMLPKPL